METQKEKTGNLHSTAWRKPKSTVTGGCWVFLLPRTLRLVLVFRSWPLCRQEHTCREILTVQVKALSVSGAGGHCGVRLWKCWRCWSTLEDGRDTNILRRKATKISGVLKCYYLNSFFLTDAQNWKVLRDQWFSLYRCLHTSGNPASPCCF
jgi:hypothetical protein